MKGLLLLTFASTSLASGTGSAQLPDLKDMGGAKAHAAHVSRPAADGVAARYDYPMDGAAYRFELVDDSDVLTSADGYDMEVLQNMTLGVGAAGVFTQAAACEQGALDPRCMDMDIDVEVVARAGLHVAEDLLLYGKVGYANARAGTSFRDYERILPAFTAGDIKGGMRLGAGMQMQVANQVYARAEYHYTNYSDHVGTMPDGSDLRTGVNRNHATVGIGFRF